MRWGGCSKKSRCDKLEWMTAGRSREEEQVIGWWKLWSGSIDLTQSKLPISCYGGWEGERELWNHRPPVLTDLMLSFICLRSWLLLCLAQKISISASHLFISLLQVSRGLGSFACGVHEWKLGAGGHKCRCGRGLLATQYPHPSAWMSPRISLDPIKTLWSELTGDIKSACHVLTPIDLPLDSWHSLQDKLSGGWWGRGWAALLPSVIVYSQTDLEPQGHRFSDLSLSEGHRQPWSIHGR